MVSANDLGERMLGGESGIAVARSARMYKGMALKG